MKWEEKASVGLLNVVHLRDHRVRVYDNRLAISRNDGQRLSWEEIQSVKEIIWGSILTIEIYPPEAEVVNKRHTRHLWKLSDDLVHSVRKSCTHPEFQFQ